MAEKIEGTIQAINKDRDGLTLASMEGWFNISQYRDPDLGPLISPSLKPGHRVRVHFQTGRGGRRYMEDLELMMNGGVPAEVPHAPAAPPTPGYVEAAIAGPPPQEPAPTVLPEPEQFVTVLPEPLNREKAILFQVCLKAAVDWVLARYPEGDPNRTEGQVLFATDLYYKGGLELINAEEEPA